MSEDYRIVVPSHTHTRICAEHVLRATHSLEGKTCLACAYDALLAERDALVEQRDEAEQSRAINHASAKLALDQRDAMAEQLARLAEAGTGYSQQTVDALTKERVALREALRFWMPDESLVEPAYRSTWLRHIELLGAKAKGETDV